CFDAGTVGGRALVVCEYAANGSISPPFIHKLTAPDNEPLSAGYRALKCRPVCETSPAPDSACMQALPNGRSGGLFLLRLRFSLRRQPVHVGAMVEGCLACRDVLRLAAPCLLCRRLKRAAV